MQTFSSRLAESLECFNITSSLLPLSHSHSATSFLGSHIHAHMNEANNNNASLKIQGKKAFASGEREREKNCIRRDGASGA